MAQYKKNTTAKVLVKFVSSSSGSPLAGVAGGSVNAAVVKGDGTTASVSVTSAIWAEITTGPFSGQGVYVLDLPGTVTNVLGTFGYAVSTSGATVYTGRDEIVDNVVADVVTILGAPAGASVSADIAQIETHASSADTKLGTPVSTIALDIAGVRGAQNLDISVIAGGAAFNSSTDSLHNIEGTIASGGVSPSAIAGAVWDELLSIHTISGSASLVLGQATSIKAKTDTLPSDPASNSSIKGGDNRDLTQIAGTGFLTGADSLVAIKTIPQLVWDETLLSHTTSGTTGATLSAVNAKTVNIPSNPSTTSDVVSARQLIMGPYNFNAGLSITDIAGSDFDSATDTLHHIEASVTAGGIDPTPIAAAVWASNISTSGGGTAGNELFNTYLKTSNLPGDPASTSGIRGGQNLTISDIAGASWSSGSDTLHIIKATIPITPPSVGAIATAIWDTNISAHTIAGTFGRVAQDTENSVTDTLAHTLQIRRLNEGHWKIFTSGPDANRLVLYSNDGTTVLQKWDLKDQTGTPATVNVFERIPGLSIP